MALKIKSIPELKGKEAIQFLDKIKYAKKGVIDFSEQYKSMKKIILKSITNEKS